MFHVAHENARRSQKGERGLVSVRGNLKHLFFGLSQPKKEFFTGPEI
jgi:hypothetical protein